MLRWLLVALLLLNVAGYLVARHDKRMAVRNRSRPIHRRIPERVFHAMALLGGGPGAYAAFLLHRHKTRKPRFLVPFVVANLAGAVWIAAAAAWLLRG